MDVSDVVDVIINTPNFLLLNKNIYHHKYFEEAKKSIEDVMYSSVGSSWTNSLGLTYVHYAVLRNDCKMLLGLIDTGANLDAASVHGETPLYMASYDGNSHFVQMLLEGGASTTSAQSAAVESELLGAVRGNSEACAQLLLNAGSLVNAATSDDWTPLHVACFQKSAALIRLLLLHGATINIIGEWTYMPLNLLFLEFAQRERFFTWYTNENVIISCLEALLAADQDVDVNYSSKCTIGNPPALQRALTLLSPTIMRLLLNNGGVADCLFEPSQRSVHDELAMLSIRKSNIGTGLDDRVSRYCRCLELLLEHGIEPLGCTLIDSMRLLLQQLRNVPLNRRRPEMEPVFQMLLDVASCPRPLRSLCRRTVRRLLGHRVEARVRAVAGLPTMVVKYVLLFEPAESAAQRSSSHL